MAHTLRHFNGSGEGQVLDRGKVARPADFVFRVEGLESAQHFPNIIQSRILSSLGLERRPRLIIGNSEPQKWKEPAVEPSSGSSYPTSKSRTFRL